MQQGLFAGPAGGRGLRQAVGQHDQLGAAVEGVPVTEGVARQLRQVPGLGEASIGLCQGFAEFAAEGLLVGGAAANRLQGAPRCLRVVLPQGQHCGLLQQCGGGDFLASAKAEQFAKRAGVGSRVGRLTVDGGGAVGGVFARIFKLRQVAQHLLECGAAEHRQGMCR